MASGGFGKFLEKLGLRPAQNRPGTSHARATTASASASSNPSAQSQACTYHCDLCGFASTLRGRVYDHIKGSHHEVIDRNGHIRENKPQERTSQ
jgi:hypothetical protein